MKVSELKTIDFKSLTLNEKLEIMRNGRPTPHIKFELFEGQKKGTLISKKMDNLMFKKIGWLCGCEEKNALFCFMCLLFGGEDDWTNDGIRDIKQLPMRIKKHECSAKHKNNLINFLLEGKEKISPNINSHHTEFIQNHNEHVKKNLDNLSKIIDVIKLCGFCDLSLTGDKEKDNKLTNYDIFNEVLDYSKKIDIVLKSYFENNEIYKNTSQIVQCELLACMVNVCRLHIYNEIKESSFLTCMVEDVTDVSTQTGIETALILRYEFQGQIYERFWGFLKSQNYEEEGLSGCLLKEIKPLVEESPEKFIAQTYDGTTDFKTRSEDLWKKIKEKYNYAHHVHSYTHKLSKIIEQVSYQISSVRIFFANLKKVSDFFNTFPERIVKLQQICNEMPSESQKKLDFESDPLRTIFENKEILVKCFENFQSGKYKPCNTKSMQEAADLLKWLKDTVFLFWLTVFGKLMPHVDNLDKTLRASPIDVIKIDEAVKHFRQIIMEFKNIFTSTISSKEAEKNLENKENGLLSKESSTDLKESNSYNFEEEYVLMKKISDFNIEESSLDSDYGTMTKTNSEIDLKETNSCLDLESISQADLTINETGSDLKESKLMLNFENSISGEKDDCSSVLEVKELDSVLDNETKDLDSEQMDVGSQTELNFKYDLFPYNYNLSSAGRLMCDSILTEINKRFKFKDHLYGPHLFINGRYERYSKKLPYGIINKFCEAYPVVEKNVLKTELEIFYKRSELHSPLTNIAGCLKTLNFFVASGLHLVFKEITKTLRIIVTLPIITRETARCVSTVDRVRRYLKTHKDQNELKVTALAILQIEKAMVKEIPEFNDKVIDIFTSDKGRRQEFHYITE